MPELLFPGMKLTIAFDDISLPLPPMRRPDVRQRVIEAVLDLAAEAGVDDVHLIAALALHRRMTEAELAPRGRRPRLRRVRAVGRLYNHDAEDPDAMAFLGTHRHGRGRRDQQARRRVRPARLRQHQPRRDGRRVEVDRHRARELPVSLRHHHNVHTMQHSRSFMDQHTQRAAQEQLADGQGDPRRGRQDLPDRDHAQHRHVPASRSTSCRSASGNGSPRDRALFVGSSKALARTPSRLARKIFQSIEGAAPDDERAGRRGRGGAREDDRERASPAARRGRRVRPTS